MTLAFDTIKQNEEALLCRTYARYPLALVKGEGSALWDIDGKRYIDLLAGIAVTSLGHCNKELADVMTAQAHKLIHVSNLFYQEEQLRLAERLLHTSHANKVFFCNSGAEANEALIKLARRFMQRVKNRPDTYEIITLEGAFHGRTLATVAATGQERLQDGFSPMPEGFKTVPWGDLDALEKAISARTAAVLVEIIQGESGVRPMTPAYAKGLEALCRKHDILFLVDEVQTGLYRTGKPWAFQHFDLRPDAFSCAKALANGLPMGAIMVTDEASQGFATGSHATTFGGGALLSAVADKTVEIMQRDQLDKRAAQLGAAFIEQIRGIDQRVPGCIKEIRGMGLMIGIELSCDGFTGKDVWLALLEAGFILNLAHDKVLRVVPALTIDEKDLQAFATCLETVLKKARAK